MMRPLLVSLLASLAPLWTACGNSNSDALPATANATIVSPSADGVANESRPSIRWRAFNGASSYRVSLYTDGALIDLYEDPIAATETKARPQQELPDGAVVYVVIEALDLAGRVQFTYPLSRFRVHLLPEWMPMFDLVTRDGASVQPGYRLLNFLDVRPPTPARVGALALVNTRGEIVWHYEYVDGSLQDNKVLPNGNILAVFGGALPNGSPRSFAREITWDGQVVWESDLQTLVHHEATIGPEDQYMLLTWVFQDVGEVSFEGDGIELVDRDTGDVTWSWNIFDHFPPERFPTPEQNNPGLSGGGRDWSHANGLAWDAERSLIWMSVRHFDALVGIDYPSGNVHAILGKGGIGGDGLLAHQHAPEMQEDGSILVYDNGNGRPTPYTRVVQLDFDENARTVEEAFEWRDDPDFYDFAVGSAFRMPNGNILITAGVSGRVIEIDPNGRIVWEIAEDSDRFWMYRSTFVPDDLIPASILPFASRSR